LKKMSSFVPQILRFASLPSTNLEAARLASEGVAEGLCVVAQEQTAGRGRLQRQWISPKGAGLYFSIILRPQFEKQIWPLLTLMAAVAVKDALLEECQLETDIKWPNDILANEKKLCGILAETVETPLGRAVVLGIGINLTNHSFPAELGPFATSVEAVTGLSHETERLLQTLTAALAKHYRELKKPQGPETIIREWCARSSYAAGKMVRVIAGDEAFVGTTRGLERDGALRVETKTGIRIAHAGDVTSLRPDQKPS
jgi:BirA family biotin operon repressor/biotin-[acetyl-CoA-carboxylase] ligase